MNIFDRTIGTTRQEALRPSGRVGSRIRVAREGTGITQASLCATIGLADRQTLSAIENGERRVTADELVRISKAVNRPLEWFIDPFVVEGEARFSWRVAQSLPDNMLSDFEFHIGRVVGMMRHLKTILRGNSSVFSPVLRVSKKSTFEDAWSWGEMVAQNLNLGIVPALSLVEAIEKTLDIPVLFVDARVENEARGISGAMCRLSDLQVIVINRHESPARRNFDVAHELFHALTWDVLEPLHREDPEEKAPGTFAKRVEQLADNFAAALLMPQTSLNKLIPEDKLADAVYLADVARELHVSTAALAFRLFNAKLIKSTVRDALIALPLLKEEAPTPKLYSEPFITLLHEGILRGHVSSRKAASALAMTLDQMSGLMSEYGKSAHFAL